MNLSKCGNKIKNTTNAGGSSVESEVLSYEIFHCGFRATLRKEEMEVKYTDRTGSKSMIDYTCTCELLDLQVGVSVTRATDAWETYDEERATTHLTEKLNGLYIAQQNAEEKWDRNMLHVFAGSKIIAKKIKYAYKNLPKDVVSNAVVLITVAESPVTLFDCHKEIQENTGNAEEVAKGKKQNNHRKRKRRKGRNRRRKVNK
ncbi:AAC-rich mRNA clone AAC4 protein-like [Apostichopus japonicus]|uniref:AAC-rich mRNA clone AAC4 protein-like n=1 Tax=Stichopus japonicus TaxID=307972 RepID=UPI003AB178B9